MMQRLNRARPSIVVVLQLDRTNANITIGPFGVYADAYRLITTEDSALQPKRWAGRTHVTLPRRRRPRPGLRKRALPYQLQCDRLPVVPIALHEFDVRAAVDDASVLHDKNPVCA